jgi:hypothetical protein
VLLRQVGDEFTARPRHSRAPGCSTTTGSPASRDSAATRVGAVVRRQRSRGGAFAQEGVADIVEAFGGDAARRHPERFKVGRHVARDRAGDEHVAVAEVVRAVPVVVIVLVIAPPVMPTASSTSSSLLCMRWLSRRQQQSDAAGISDS